MKTYSDKIKRIKEALDGAAAVLIGAGAGLSTAAGYVYTGERFKKYFADYIEKYGFADMYSGGFYPFASPEEMWAYWSRYIYINRYLDPPKDTYKKLLELVKNKDYFVITTNVDHCFQKAGFDKERLFYTQGDYGLFQCCVPCHNKTYDNEEIVKAMYENQADMKIPSSLVPKCPVCGENMTMNLRSDDRFVEDEGWHGACRRYLDFKNKIKAEKAVFLEIGVGYNTPGIIKYPFWEQTAENDRALYVCLNFGDTYCPESIKDRAVCISGDADEIISDLLSSEKDDD